VAAVTGGDKEHDAVFYPDGERDFYPNQQNPNHLAMRPSTGGRLDLICMNQDCTELLLRTSGLKSTDDMSVELVKVDSKISIIRDGVTEKQLGYLAENQDGKFVAVQTLEEAQAAERPPESGTSKALKSAGSGTAKVLKTAGKIALGTLIVTAVVAGAVAEGMSEARANAPATTPVYLVPSTTPTFTNCNSFGNSVSCMSY
jgi:hypothetical protein